MIETLSKAKKADLEAEVALYREAGVETALDENLDTNAKLVEEIERLQKEHGFPVKMTEEFANDNPELAKILTAAGAAKDEVVFAEPADLEQVKAIEAEAAEREEILAELKDLGIEELDPNLKTLSELKEELEKAKANKNSNGGAGVAPKKPTEETPADAKEDLVYFHSENAQPVTVVSVANAIAFGKSYKDIVLVTGETLCLSPDEFNSQVKPRA